MNVAEVNRAGSGASALWDCSGCSGGPQQSTSISASEAYTCPASLLAPYTSFSGTANCIQVKVSSPPCQQNPNTSYTFPDGNTEKQEFPCTTPGFGTANANWSKLQDMQPGDWLLTNAGSQNENLVLLVGDLQQRDEYRFVAAAMGGAQLSGAALSRQRRSQRQRARQPVAAVHGADLCDECRGAGRIESRTIPGPRAIRCASLRTGRRLQARLQAGRGFVFLSTGLVWRKLYRQLSTPRCRIYCGAHCSRRLPLGPRLPGATTGRATR